MVKKQRGKLTDDPVDMISGKRDQLAGRIQELYGLSTDEAEQRVRNFERRYRGWTPRSKTATAG
jgi:uncharacterized protein YjbJ (UPF0337 family)